MRTVGLALTALCAVGITAIALGGVLYIWVDREGLRDESGPADCIIVLGCAVWPHEQPSPALRARVERGLAAYRAGHAPAVILCGGVGTNPPAEAEVMRRLMIAADAPADALYLDDASHSTLENLQHAQTIMREHGWRSALLVSDPFHLPRASLMARDLGIDARPAPALDSPAYTRVRDRTWYTCREVLTLVWYWMLERPGVLSSSRGRPTAATL